jgi:hypothetical protein
MLQSTSVLRVLIGHTTEQIISVTLVRMLWEMYLKHRKYSSALVSTGNTLQDLLRLLETANNT